MKLYAEIQFKDITIRNAEVCMISDYIFTFDLPYETSTCEIKYITSNGGEITCYTSYIHVTLKRKDVTAYELFRMEE